MKHHHDHMGRILPAIGFTHQNPACTAAVRRRYICRSQTLTEMIIKLHTLPVNA